VTRTERELVLDTSVLAKWFRPEPEVNTDAALRLLDEFEAGDLHVVVPPLVYLELLNIGVRRWATDADQLLAFASRLLGLPFTVRQPDLLAVARWTARGLTAYDACYVALAEERGTTVVTDDRQMLTVGPGIAVPLA